MDASRPCSPETRTCCAAWNDDDDLELAERALRGLAHRYRHDAERTQNPLIRDGFEEHAKRCERIAAIIARFRMHSAKSKWECPFAGT